MSALDTQIGGSHYKDMPIQPMEFSMANNLDACQHTVVKYVTRFREKGGVQDLEKAKHVIDMLIEFEGKAQDEVKSFMGEPTAEGKCDDVNCPGCFPENRGSIGDMLAAALSAAAPKADVPTGAAVSAALKTLLEAGVITHA